MKTGKTAAKGRTTKFKVGDLVSTEYGLAVITRRSQPKQRGDWFYHFTVAEGTNAPASRVGGFAPLFQTGARAGDWEELIDLAT